MTRRPVTGIWCSTSKCSVIAASIPTVGLPERVHFYPGITALGPISKFADDPWELYHVAEDFSMAEDLSKKYPEKLKELEEMFYAEAEKYHVLPIDDRLSRFNATIAGRPTVLGDRKSQVLYEGMGYLSENAFVNIKNASWDIVADIESQGAKTSGVLVQQGQAAYLRGLEFLRIGRQTGLYLQLVWHGAIQDRRRLYPAGREEFGENGLRL